MKIVLVLLGIMVLTGCQTREEYERAMLQQDINTCVKFGADYGSPAHYQCMLIQQQRRDWQQAQTAAQANALAAQIRMMSY